MIFRRPLPRRVLSFDGFARAYRQLVVFLPNWIGDAVMATPALDALGRECRTHGVRLIGVMKPVIAELLSSEDFFDAVWPADKSNRRGPGSRREIIQRMRRESIDAALLLTNSWRTAWWAWRGGARRRWGYAQDGRSWLLTDAIRRARWRGRRLPRSAVDDYIDLVRVCGVYVDSPRVRLTVGGNERAVADAAWQRWNWPGRRVVALHPGAAFGAAKCWPAEHFIALAKRLLARDPDLRVLVLCGPGEESAARHITHQVASPRMQTVADIGPSIALTKGSLAKCQLLVTGDSGPRHIAAALGTPTITLFGSTDPVWSDNYCPHDHWLQRSMTCRPCAARTCPLQHHRCMKELYPEKVLQACNQVLAERQTARHVG